MNYSPPRPWWKTPGTYLAVFFVSLIVADIILTTLTLNKSIKFNTDWPGLWALAWSLGAAIIFSLVYFLISLTNRYFWLELLRVVGKTLMFSAKVIVVIVFGIFIIALIGLGASVTSKD